MTAFGFCPPNSVAAGVRACLDERDVNPPAVYVGPPVIAWRFRSGDFTATFTAWCVVGNSGRDIATRNLGVLVEQAVTALGMVAVTAICTISRCRLPAG